MRIALILLSAASVFAQSQRVNRQEYCFKNPTSAVCPGHEYANTKPKPTSQPAPTRSVTTSVFSPNQRTAAAPALIVVGGIDWRFADPYADALVGFNFSNLSASPLARGLIGQLAAKQGLGQKDVQKIFDALSEVDQVAVSIRSNRVVVMVSGRVTESALPAPEAGFKSVSLFGDTMLIGHADAVDQGASRINMKGTLGELAQTAAARQASSEFWVIGSPALVGPGASGSGMRRFSLAVSIRDRMTSDLALEFNGIPNPNVVRSLKTSLGNATLEGNSVHLRMAMEANEAQQKFAQIISGQVGQQLGALIEAARYLPARENVAPKQTRPVIYGLDDGPKVVNQD